MSSAESPRFGTAHLMLWISMSAVWLGIARDLAERQGTEPGRLGLLVLVVIAACHGASMAALAVGVWRWRRKTRQPMEPGHWLAAALGVRGILELFVQLNERMIANPHAVVMTLFCIPVLIPTWQRRMTTCWRALFCFLALTFALWPLRAAAGILFGGARLSDWGIGQIAEFAPAIATAAILGVTIRERYRGVVREWTHLAGVAIWVWWFVILVGLRK